MTGVASIYRNPVFRRCAVWAGLALACSAFALCNVYSWYPVRQFAAYKPDWRQAILWEMLRWNLWLPVFAATGFLYARIDQRRRRETFALFGVITVLFPAIHTVLFVLVYVAFSAARLAALFRYRSFVLIGDYLTGIIVCAMALGWLHSRNYYLRLRDEELKASRLEAQLAQARLDALKMQLQPHFLFNSLNAIAALQGEDIEAAQKMMARLADFLRMTLENSGSPEVALSREIDFLSRYLEIERIRFPDRLAVDMRIDPDTLDAQVPNLILQPIVENAIRHGIAQKATPGRVEISSCRRSLSLLLRVRDTGPGLGARPSREGVGLTNTRARLNQMYGAQSRLSLADAPGGGLEVMIEIPFCTTPA
jgi:two-component system LytT family sensor kinase